MGNHHKRLRKCAHQSAPGHKLKVKKVEIEFDGKEVQVEKTAEGYLEVTTTQKELYHIDELIKQKKALEERLADLNRLIECF